MKLAKAILIILIIHVIARLGIMLHAGIQAYRLIPEKNMIMKGYYLMFSFAWVYFRGFCCGLAVAYLFSKVKKR